MRFDCGIATTFSLDPTALLTLPVHLAWLAAGSDQELLGDPIRLLEAMRRVADRLTVFCDRGRMLVPDFPHALYGLLEPIIHEARAPQGGAFHPKVWLLRFVDENNENPLLRLMILSRNLTFDNSWDLSLQLECRPGKKLVPSNQPLSKFLKVISKASIKTLSADRHEILNKLGEECRKCIWELPSGFKEINFHILGVDSEPWLPPASDELAVISPFVREDALKALVNTTNNARFLFARSEELDNISHGTVGKFDYCAVLAEQAETGDSEDEAGTASNGLHAKAYLLRKGWYTHLFVGSANASDRVIAPDVKARNLEILVELSGLESKVGGIDKLLSEEGLTDILTPYQPPNPDEPKHMVSAAEKTLERIRERLSASALAISCAQIDDAWQLTLTADSSINLEDAALLVWPLTIPGERAVNGQALALGGGVVLETVATEQVTSLIGFALALGDEELRFGLEVPIDNPPLDRDAAIMRLIIRNRDGFLRYLLMMLEDLSGEFAGASIKHLRRTGGVLRFNIDDLPLFEMLARTFARDPASLLPIGRLVNKLASDTGEAIVPPEFLRIWSVFVKAMAKGGINVDDV
jgi:hypothetical protein